MSTSGSFSLDTRSHREVLRAVRQAPAARPSPARLQLVDALVLLHRDRRGLTSSTTSQANGGESSVRATTHECVCIECGVRFKARELHGQIKPTNAPSDEQIVLVLCAQCEASE